MKRDDILGYLAILGVILLIGFFIWLYAWGPYKACYDGRPISETPNYCMIGSR